MLMAIAFAGSSTSLKAQSPPADASDRVRAAIGRRGLNASIADVLEWSRRQDLRVALQSQNDPPRIDNTSSTEAPIPADIAEPNDGSPGDFGTFDSSVIPDDVTPAELVAILRLLQRQVNTNTQMIGNNSVLSQQLKSQLEDLTDQYSRNLSAQQRILQQQQAAISSQQTVIDSVTREDAGGRRLLELSGNMSLSSGFVDEVNNAIERTRPTEGTLVIRNPLAHDQTVVVNSQQHVVVAGATLQLKLPLGNVVTHVPGGGTYHWFLGAPQYEVYIRLVE